MRLVVVSVLFNPAGYQRIEDNWAQYSRAIEGQGAPLLTVRVEGPRIRNTGIPTRSMDHGGRVAAVNTSSILWHKEDAINLAVRELIPSDADAVAWIDSDILLEPGILDRASKLLETHEAVQLFEDFEWLGPSGNPGTRRGVWAGGTPDLRGRCHGGAWAARRETIEAIGGLYDRAIVGGGDSAWVAAILGETGTLPQRGWFPRMIESWEPWATLVGQHVRRVGTTGGTARHLYHGANARRQYRSRHYRLHRLGFDPVRHLETGDGGLMEWSYRAPAKMRFFVERYFAYRRDDQ